MCVSTEHVEPLSLLNRHRGHSVSSEALLLSPSTLRPVRAHMFTLVLIFHCYFSRHSQFPFIVFDLKKKINLFLLLLVFFCVCFLYARVHLLFVLFILTLLSLHLEFSLCLRPKIDSLLVFVSLSLS